MVRRQHTETEHVAPKETDLLFGQCPPVDPGCVRALKQRIVDISDVLRVFGVDSGIAPRALHRVEGEVRRSMAEVSCVVGRDTANVQRRSLIFDRRVFEAAGGRIEQAWREALARKGRKFWRGPGSHCAIPFSAGDAVSSACAVATPPSGESTPVLRSTMITIPSRTRYTTKGMKLPCEM